jgi:hypothetical protein
VGSDERARQSAAVALKASHHFLATPAQFHPNEIDAESTKSRGCWHTE